MPFTITVIHQSGFLLIEAAGSATLADHCALVDFTAALAAGAAHRRALINLTDVENNLSFTEHLTLGSYAADKLRSLERVASVVSEQNRRGTSEKAAQKLGLKVQTFTSLEDGLRWVASRGIAEA